MIGRLPGEDQDDLVRAWEDALASLEHDVQVAERMLTGPYDVVPTAAAADTGWQPPHLAGPVPSGLLVRARDLVRRQAAVRSGLARALAQTRSELGQLRAGTPGSAVRSAAYVDVSA